MTANRRAAEVRRAALALLLTDVLPGAAGVAGVLYIVAAGAASCVGAYLYTVVPGAARATVGAALGVAMCLHAGLLVAVRTVVRALARTRSRPPTRCVLDV